MKKVANRVRSLERSKSAKGAGNGHHFDPGHGRLMKEWVAVAPGKAPWLDLAREAHRYIESGS
jgi:hypothetical protein